MNDVTTRDTEDQPPMPVHQQRAGLPTAANAGAVSIEIERAIAEARGQMQLAKMFPRDVNAAYAELMESCKQPAMAQAAFYSVPRGGQNVTGPSIRLAEEIARVYGNFEFGHRELSRGNGKSEVEVYAWDKQANNRSIRQITVAHIIDTRGGPKPCRDQADIDALIANKASKQVRGRILALVPKWLEAAAIEQCKKTLAGGSDKPISVQVRDMITAFAKYGVTLQHVEKYLEKKTDECTLDDLVELRGVYTALREGAPVGDYFGEKKAAEEAPAAPQIGAPANDNQPAAHPATAGRKRQQSKDAAEPGAGTVVAPVPAAQQQAAAPAQAETTKAAPAAAATPAAAPAADDNLF